MSAPLREHDRGFTLLELMTVVALLAILVAIAITSYNVTTARSRRIACLHNQRLLQSVVSVYETDNDGKSPEVLEDLKPYVNWPSANYGRCTLNDVPLVFDPVTCDISCTTPGHQ